MFRTMDGVRTALLALVAIGAAALGRPAPARGQADVWSPRTVPLFGVSYAPDIGLQLGAGMAHTRYGFRALPASTRLVVTAEYATGAERFRARADGEFRRPLVSAGDVGVFGLADGGRVWVTGESSDRWHGAAGGG